ncbi:alpha amylase C-terminal domain-containing protein [Cellulophaga sp. HaHaR_3_176]|uniref:alpha-amylase family glycosyl hydrolase n=1 Tax=Cellulophaga sp. HaHaR_3_176 TaxID=1942464 RepID=UPI001C1FE88D|nr:alpha-amylase family glycosyl hydrolase [Cellulophaga sp. HaHaR_3_176]QWX85012.1 alpha amylase C-terminal domain-containing protein [Cellulophaga sp. HaHaR_3_176]
MAEIKYKEMDMTINKSQGMGAVLKDGETTFRVWAPNAEKVFVMGSFNDWKRTSMPLALEENGYWAAAFDSVKEGDEYKYIIHTNCKEYERNDPYAFEVTSSIGNSIVRTLNFDWGDDNFKMAHWNELVIYELHVGTFNRKDPNEVANFDSVIEKLPYLQKLGINCIELLPVAEFAGGISWGYNPAHPFAIEQDYGGPDAFARLVKAAHEKGIAVIIDVVYNHLGPSDVDLWQFDGWGENDKGGIYFYNDHRSATPWGDTRPDYGRPEVRQYLRDNALMWIEKYKCDGLRMDATSYIRYEGGGLGYDTEIEEGNILMRDINAELQEKYPHILTIAEDLKGENKVTDAIEHNGLGYGSQWDMNFVHPVREVLEDPYDTSRDLQKIVDALEFKYSTDVFTRIVYTESHDEVANGKARVPEEIQPGDAESTFAKKRAILGLALTLTAPGIPMLFQGQEFIEDEYFQDTEGLDWEKFEKHQGIQKLVRDLILLRTGKQDKTAGLRDQEIQIVHFNNDTKILAYIRKDREHKEPVLVLLNFSTVDYQDYGIGLEGNVDWKLRFNSSWNGYDSDFSDLEIKGINHSEEETDGQDWTGKLTIPGYCCQIYTL